jgi:protein-disulfide isomerase
VLRHCLKRQRFLTSLQESIKVYYGRNFCEDKGLPMTKGPRCIALAAVAVIITVLSVQSQTSQPNAAELWLAGQRSAPVRMELFSDFQCPVCRTFYLETIKPLIADYTKANKIDKISIAYHDFPLDMHPFARKAARLALAASRLGRERWLHVVDVLYVEQEKWAQDGNIEAILAKSLDPTEMVRLQSLASNPAIEGIINQEIQLGQSQNINSTPTFLILTQTGRQQRVVGGVAFAVLKDYLDRLIN